MKSKLNNIWTTLTAIGRGIKRVFGITVGVFEALAWIILLGIGYTVIYHNLKGYIALNDVAFYAVVFATIAISFRAAYELGDYFRKVGTQYER